MSNVGKYEQTPATLANMSQDEQIREILVYEHFSKCLQILANISKYEQRALIFANTGNMNTYAQYAQT